MLHVGAIHFHILAELLCDGGITFKQVFTGHAGLTGCATRIDDILGTGEGFLDVRRERHINTFEAAVEHFLGHTFQTRSVRVVEAYVRRQSHHDSRLGHVGTNHAGCADDGKFVVCYEVHNNNTIYE